LAHWLALPCALLLIASKLNNDILIPQENPCELRFRRNCYFEQKLCFQFCSKPSSASGATKRRKKREAEELTKKLPKISTFLVDRESFQSDAIEGEPGEASTSQTIQTTQCRSGTLPLSITTESDRATEHTFPLTLTLVDSTEPNSIYTNDQCAVDSQQPRQAENPDVVSDQTEDEKDNDMGPVGEFTDLMSKENLTDMGHFGDVVDDE